MAGKKKFKFKKKNFPDVDPKIKIAGIYFNDGMSHRGVLAQAINALAEAGFASRKEIVGEWYSLLSLWSEDFV